MELRVEFSLSSELLETGWQSRSRIPPESKAVVYAKPAIKDLASGCGTWTQPAPKAVEEAIRGLRFPKGDASFSGTAKNGRKWTGWFRDGRIQTVFVEF